MILTSLSVQNFRLFSEKKIDFENRLVLFGDNGTGKSSIIEALRIITVGKSFKTNRFDECIKDNESFFRIMSNLKTDDDFKKIDYFYGKQFENSIEKTRLITCNDQEMTWLDVYKLIPSVLLTLDDIELVFGSPQERRRFIDSILWQVDLEARESQIRLIKILKERSVAIFLYKINKATKKEIEPWNTLLTEETLKIRDKRLTVVEEINKYLEKQNSHIEVSLKYRYPKEDIEYFFNEEVRLAQNIYGPHRDDLTVDINQRSGRKYSSRGQARTAAVLLRLAEILYIKEHKTDPLILLDDIFSELDRNNINFLFDQIDANNQVIITAVNETEPLLSKWPKMRI